MLPLRFEACGVGRSLAAAAHIQLAERMFLAEKTVKNYVSNVLAKLDMGRRSEAAAYAARLAASRRALQLVDELRDR